MRWFREGPSPFQMPLAMIGVKAGDRVLVLGAQDGALAAEVARVTGLNGRTLVVDPDSDAAARLEARAADAGSLVEFERAPLAMLPLDAGSFDIVVMNSPLGEVPHGHRTIMFGEARRVLRSGGRVVSFERGPRPGLFGLIPRSAPPVLGREAMIALLEQTGFRAVRLLADRDGVAYYEGRA
jgi:ubiquinone/menaquinone biosynthesis C-methylase UbiE